MKTKIKQIVSSQEADSQDLAKLGEKVVNMAAKYNYNSIKLIDELNNLTEHVKYSK